MSTYLRFVFYTETPPRWCTKSILFSWRKWDVVVCDSVVSLGLDLYCQGSLLQGCKHWLWTQSIWTQHLWEYSFGDSRCSSGTTKAALMLLIFHFSRNTQWLLTGGLCCFLFSATRRLIFVAIYFWISICVTFWHQSDLDQKERRLQSGTSTDMLGR